MKSVIMYLSNTFHIGCIGQDDLEFTILSKHYPKKVLKLDKKGKVEPIELPNFFGDFSPNDFQFHEEGEELTPPHNDKPDFDVFEDRNEEAIQKTHLIKIRVSMSW